MYWRLAAGTARRVKKARGTSCRPCRAPRRGASRAARTAAAAARARPRSARHDRRGFLEPGRPTAARLFSLACSPGLGFGLSVSWGLPVSRCLGFAAVSLCRGVAASRSLGRIAARSLACAERRGGAGVVARARASASRPDRATRDGRITGRWSYRRDARAEGTTTRDDEATAEVASADGAALRSAMFLFTRLVSRAVGRRRRTIAHRRLNICLHRSVTKTENWSKFAFPPRWLRRHEVQFAPVSLLR